MKLFFYSPKNVISSAELSSSLSFISTILLNFSSEIFTLFATIVSWSASICLSTSIWLISSIPSSSSEVISSGVTLLGDIEAVLINLPTGVGSRGVPNSSSSMENDLSISEVDNFILALVLEVSVEKKFSKTKYHLKIYKT